MGDILIGHGQNGQLGNGTITASDTTSTLIDTSEIGVPIESQEEKGSLHVTGITSSRRDLLTSRGDFSKGICITRDSGLQLRVYLDISVRMTRTCMSLS